MPTIQIWVTDSDMEDLRRLKKFLEHQVEKEFGEKAWRLSASYYRRGKRRRKRIRRPRINNSYIYREALKLYWFENEQHVITYEKSKGDR